MKFKHVIVLSSLSFLVTGGLVAGLSARDETKAVKSAKAAVGSSGNVIVRKDDNDMKYTGSSLVAYLFNDTENAWIEPEVNDGKTYQELTWSLEFVPTKIIVLRVDTGAWKASDPWKNVWSRTGNVDLMDTEVIWMRGSAGEYTTGDWGSFSCVATVKGGNSDSWSDPTIDMTLGHIKTDGDKIEVYDSVSFDADTYFKVVKGSVWYNNYAAHSSITSNLSLSDNGNIHNAEAATYEVYFNFEDPSIYITDPARAAADEFAQSFLGKTIGYCSGSEAISEGVQAELKGEYDALHDIEGAQALFYSAEVKRGKGVDYESFASQALSRYVNMQEEKGYGDFLGLGAHNPEINPAIYGYLFANDTNNTAIIVITIATTSVLAFTLLLVFKKKKQK